MALHFTPIVWTAIGPFTFQTSRILHYLAYFLVGVAVGAGGVDGGLLANDGKLARRWPAWSVAALILFAAAAGITIANITSSSPMAQLAMDAGFVFSCAASCLAFTSLFIRFARRSPILDSLSTSSYGIYLVHYIFVSWLQYSLLTVPVSAVVKGTAVFLGALALSWAVSAGGVRALRTCSPPKARSRYTSASPDSLRSSSAPG
jgi:peptidoglycan/LPS O-acetylase OafA/YrhL